MGIAGSRNRRFFFVMAVMVFSHVCHDGLCLCAMFLLLLDGAYMFREGCSVRFAGLVWMRCGPWEIRDVFATPRRDLDETLSRVDSLADIRIQASEPVSCFIVSSCR